MADVGWGVAALGMWAASIGLVVLVWVGWIELRDLIQLIGRGRR